MLKSLTILYLSLPHTLSCVLCSPRPHLLPHVDARGAGEGVLFMTAEEGEGKEEEEEEGFAVKGKGECFFVFFSFVSSSA